MRFRKFEIFKSAVLIDFYALFGILQLTFQSPNQLVHNVGGGGGVGSCQRLYIALQGEGYLPSGAL
jgi:hypothetical protein